MKALKTVFITGLLLCLCSVSFGQREIFIKQIDFKLDFLSDIEYENEHFVTIKFNKGSKYVFKIQNHLEDYKGEAIIELLDADQLIMTNFISDKYFTTISFQCNKTGFYDILVKFKDNRLGNSRIDITMMQ
ncbi:MAG: hypothetical protein MI922_21905 [Bacteroidales bacterium]|nr:hypothetical protein [Bacteroidales bacterium]